MMNWRHRRVVLMMAAVAIAIGTVPALAEPFSRQKYARQGFNFSYESSRGNRIDTYKSTLTKDLIGSQKGTMR